MLLEKIEKRLTDPVLVESWRGMARDWPGTEDPGRWAALNHVVQRRDRALTTLREIADDDQLIETIAILYIELKSEWIMLNTMVNYQLFRKQQSDGEAVLRAALVSSLLSAVEDMLTAKDIATITCFLSTPINQKSEDSDSPDTQSAVAA